MVGLGRTLRGGSSLLVALEVARGAAEEAGAEVGLLDARELAPTMRMFSGAA